MPSLLGSCCVCGTFEGVTNLITLHQRAPVPGTGWGCFLCQLPEDGAVAVTCDQCLRLKLVWACHGYPHEGKRVPIESLEGEFDHDHELHRRHDVAARAARQ